MANAASLIRDLRIAAEVRREFRAASSVPALMTDRLRSRTSEPSLGFTCTECHEPRRGWPWTCLECGQVVCTSCRRVGPHRSPGGVWCKGRE